MVEHRQNRGLDPAPVGPLCGPVQLPRSNGGGKVAPGSEREGALGSVRLRVNRHAWTGVCAGLAGRIGARGWVGPRNRTGGWHARNRHGPRRALARAWAPTAAAGSPHTDRKSTRLNSSHGYISYAVFCLKKKKTTCDLPKTAHDDTTIPRSPPRKKNRQHTHGHARGPQDPAYLRIRTGVLRLVCTLRSAR